MRRFAALLTFLPLLAWADLSDIRKEPAPERRFELSIDRADTLLKETRSLADQGDIKKLADVLEDVAGACELGLQSLRDTGKRPSKLGKYYKKGELRTRDYIRRLENLENALNFDDRPLAAKAKNRVTVMHEEFLLGVMSKD